jgi:hypothetical protein
MSEPGRPEQPGQQQIQDRGPVHPSSPNEQPPDPPRELEPEPIETRQFTAQDRQWLAWVSGKSVAGSGGYGLAMMVAVHFALEDEPDRPTHEALLPRGQFAGLFDDELRTLLGRATPIVIPRTEPG